jgi:hypothetical protein
MLTMTLLAVLAQVQVEAHPPVQPLPPTEVAVGLISGVRLGNSTTGVAGALMVNHQVTRWLRPELVLGTGPWLTPVEMLTIIRIGARLEWPLESRWHPYLWVAFAHSHETDWKDVAANPISSILGLSENGVRHRSGADLGLGLGVDLPKVRKDGMPGRLNVRASVVSLLGSGPPVALELMATAGVCF